MGKEEVHHYGRNESIKQEGQAQTSALLFSMAGKKLCEERTPGAMLPLDLRMQLPDGVLAMETVPVVTLGSHLGWWHL